MNPENSAKGPFGYEQAHQHNGLVIAGSYSQFRHWCSAEGESHRLYHYVDGPNDLYKVPDEIPVTLVGTYYNRPDWPELQDMVEVRKRRLEKLARGSA